MRMRTATMAVRDRILDTAARLFYTQGYNSTGINQVIEEAEVAKASFYQYFPSKEDLLIEYLHITIKETNSGIQAMLDKYGLPEEKAIAVFDFLIKQVKQSEFNGCNFLNILSEIPQDNVTVRGLVKKQKNYIRGMFTKILEPIGKEALADQLYLLFDAALISSKVYADTWPVKLAREMAKKII
jgi:AcrR family transcriptional regulator